MNTNKLSYAELSENGIIVLRNTENGEYAYTGTDGRLHMSHGADRERTVPVQECETYALSLSFSPVHLVFDELGKVAWDQSEPKLDRLPLSRMWLEGQAKMA